MGRAKISRSIIFFSEINRAIRRNLKKHPEVTNEQAFEIATKVQDELIEEFGGEILYIHTTRSQKQGSRDRKILDEFNGKNYRYLARKYNLSLQWIYKIIKQAKKEQSKNEENYF